MATLNLGRIKPIFKGAYAGGTAYVVDDIVTSGNECFICILASTGNATSNATYWTKLAAKGTDGTDLTSTLTTQGDVVYRDGSGLARLGFGTSGHVLTTKGTGANPVWEAASGGKVLQVTNDMITTSYLATGTTETVVWTGATLTLAATSSKVLIMGTFSLGGDYGGSMALQYSTNNGVAWNDITTANMGSTDDQQASKALLGFHGNPSTAGNTSVQTGINYMHSPSNVSAKYRLAMLGTTSAYEFSMNRRTGGDYGGFSFVTQMEIGA